MARSKPNRFISKRSEEQSESFATNHRASSLLLNLRVRSRRLNVNWEAKGTKFGALNSSAESFNTSLRLNLIVNVPKIALLYFALLLSSSDKTPGLKPSLNSAFSLRLSRMNRIIRCSRSNESPRESP